LCKPKVVYALNGQEDIGFPWHSFARSTRLLGQGLIEGKITGGGEEARVGLRGSTAASPEGESKFFKL